MDAPRRLAPILCRLLLLAACAAPPATVRIEPLPLPNQTRTVARGSLPAHAVRIEPVSAIQQPAAEDGTPSSPPVAAQPAPEPAQTAALDDTAVQAAIAAALGADADHYSVVVRRLRDGRGATLNPDREFYAASLFKLALLYEATRQRSAGLLDFDTAVQVTERDAAEDLGTFDRLGVEVGDYLPVGDAVRAMITMSDNASAVLTLYLLGPATVDRTLRALGLQHTSVNTTDLPTTAADMALLMEAIVRGVGVEATWRDEMLGVLARQETRVGIPRLLPADVRVGNKTGTWPGATHDVAFVEAPTGTYVIAVLSDRGWDWDPIARVSRAIYDVMTK